MFKYQTGLSTTGIVLLVVGIIAALFAGNALYKNLGSDDGANQEYSGQPERSTEDSDSRQQQMEPPRPPTQADGSTKQALIDKAKLGMKASFDIPDNAGFNIDIVLLDVPYGGSRQDVVCGTIKTENKSDTQSGPARFVWRSSEPAELEDDGNKALFQLAWSLFCRN